MTESRSAGEPLAVAVAGCGYWGPNYVRNFNDSPGARVVAIADPRRERLDPLTNRYPTVRATNDFGDLLVDDEIEAIAIATPVSTHFELGRAALEAGKHVLLAKPMAATTAEAEALHALAQAVQRTLLVDHTFIYGAPVRKIRDLLERGDLGEPYYIDSVRINLGLFQQDVNVIWDLAAHDLSIAMFLAGPEPVSVHAVGASHAASSHEDVAYVTLSYPDRLIAHCHVNWLSPVKIRQTLVAGSEKMLVWNDLAADEQVKIYDHGVTINHGADGFYKMLVDYRMGDVWTPHLDRYEPLSALVEHFVGCVRRGEPPLTDGEFGVGVIRLLEASAASLREGGRAIEVTAAASE